MRKSKLRKQERKAISDANKKRKTEEKRARRLANREKRNEKISNQG